MPKAKGPSAKQLAIYAARSPGQVIEKRSIKGQLMYYVVQPNKRLLRIPAPPTSKEDIARARASFGRVYKSHRAMASDLSRTSKSLTKNADTWMRNPGRYDMEGVDTKGSIKPVGTFKRTGGKRATRSGGNAGAKRRRVD